VEPFCLYVRYGCRCSKLRISSYEYAIPGYARPAAELFCARQQFIHAGCYLSISTVKVFVEHLADQPTYKSEAELVATPCSFMAEVSFSSQLELLAPNNYRGLVNINWKYALRVGKH
jgi:hypothetical protein